MCIYPPLHFLSDCIPTAWENSAQAKSKITHKYFHNELLKIFYTGDWTEEFPCNKSISSFSY